jgi:predicted MFS family arabinose efflux permease
MTSRHDDPASPGAGPPHGSISQDLRAGLSILRNQPATRTLLPVTVIFLTANACLSAVIIPLGVQHLGGSRQTGILFAALGAGFLAAAPVLRVLLDRAQPRYLLSVTLAATAVGYWLLFHAPSLATALPAAVAIGMTGSMCLVIPHTTVQRVIPSAALGRVNAVFLTGEAAATLTGAVAGPILTQAIGLGGMAAAASLTTIAAAVLTALLLSATPLPGKPVPGPAP